MAVKQVKVPIEQITIDSIRSAAREASKDYVLARTRTAVGKMARKAFDKFLEANKEQIESELAHLLSKRFDEAKTKFVEKEVDKVMARLNPKPKAKKHYYSGY